MTAASRLRAAQRRYEAAEAKSDKAREARNAAVRDAAAGGMTYRQIAAVTGLSVQRVAQVAKPRAAGR
jgi:hypothetical protein